MKRRDFITKAGMAAAATIAMPYILPSGLRAAPSGARLANHVVFCLFAGGVRNLESVHKADGNLMPYTLNGSESISPDILPGMTPLPSPSGSALQNSGTLYREFRYKEGPTGHYNAHTTAITGHYVSTNVQLRQPPPFPTVFELYRKHSSPSESAKNAWWITDSLGPYPYLNFSNYAGYGPMYGANMVQPLSIFNPITDTYLGDPKSFHPDELVHAGELRNFFNNQFGKGFSAEGGIQNAPEDAEQIKAFLLSMMDQAASGAFNDPYGVGTLNNDMYNLFTASKVIEEFQPELLVVNMTGIDVCHTNYTQYANNIRRADFALSKLWETIQSTPGMADDTILIAAPEHGRNLEPNTLIDIYGRYAIDHTNDEMSRQIFCLVAGPSGVVNQGSVISSEKGESIDIVPTIAKVLGFDTSVPAGLMPGEFLTDAFI